MGQLISKNATKVRIDGWLQWLYGYAGSARRAYARTGRSLLGPNKTMAIDEDWFAGKALVGLTRFGNKVKVHFVDKEGHRYKCVGNSTSSEYSLRRLYRGSKLPYDNMASFVIRKAAVCPAYVQLHDTKGYVYFLNVTNLFKVFTSRIG
jgi:hypothetical protein